MQKLVVVIFSLLFFQIVTGQNTPTLQDSIANYFKETKLATKKGKKLWDIDLYGPILLVDYRTRQVYSNYPDSAGLLKQNGEIYSGILPGNIVLGNRSLKWGGTSWAMIITAFITADKTERIELFSHELFHKAQPALNFPMVNAKNNAHLDQKDGRIYLRLELEALKKAIQNAGGNEMKVHLTNALIFRKYRYQLFPDAYSSESIVELNEGIASYTGKVISGIEIKEAAVLMEKRINKFFTEPSFVQSFAYYTIPVYGYILRESKKYWNKKIDAGTNLTDYFVHAFGLSLPPDLKKTVQSITRQYNGEKIFEEEIAREEKANKLIAEYKNKFIAQPHFEIQFEKKSVSFDSRFVLTIEDKGVVYPTMTASDKWGVLTVEKGGGLISPPELNTVTITIPLKIEGNNITGDGWTLRLNDGYAVVKDESTGNYKLVKK